MNTKPPIIQTEEYARINIDLYLLRSSTRKLPPFALLTSGTTWKAKRVFKIKNTKFPILNINYLLLVAESNFHLYPLSIISEQVHLMQNPIEHIKFKFDWQWQIANLLTWPTSFERLRCRTRPVGVDGVAPLLSFCMTI